MPALFVHGSRDPFGSLEELRAAIALIPAPTALVPIDGAGHDLLPTRQAAHRPIDLASVAAALLALVDSTRGA